MKAGERQQLVERAREGVGDEVALVGIGMETHAVAIAIDRAPDTPKLRGQRNNRSAMSSHEGALLPYRRFQAVGGYAKPDARNRA